MNDRINISRNIDIIKNSMSMMKWDFISSKELVNGDIEKQYSYNSHRYTLTYNTSEEIVKAEIEKRHFL